MTDIPEGYMEDQHGRLVPERLVKGVDKLRDQTVKEIVAGAKQQRDALARWKAGALADFGEFLETAAEEYNTSFGGQKGNVTLTTYDGRYKIVRAINERLSFNERIQIAKQKIDTCIHRWAEDSNDYVRALVEHAFQTDTQGTLSTSRILGLRRLDINDPEWLEAMRAINDSIEVEGSKTYLRLYERDETTGQWRPIPLDIAAL